MMKFSHRFFYSSLLPAYFQKVKTQSRRKIWDEGWRYDRWKRSAIYLISFCLISSRVVANYRSRGKRQNARPRCFNQKFVERGGRGTNGEYFSLRGVLDGFIKGESSPPPPVFRRIAKYSQGSFSTSFFPLISRRHYGEILPKIHPPLVLFL